MSNKAFWVVTANFGLFFILSGLGSVLAQEPIMENYVRLGLPRYMATILGGAKIFGGLVVLIPQVPRRIKDLAYDGFLILILGGISCHLFSGDTLAQTAPLIVGGILGAASFVLWRKKLG